MKNLSGELDCNDRYGHGTFIAGLVAGNGASSGGKWKGVAPEASVLSVKTAGADGAADVSNILAAIQWVVSFKDRYNIRCSTSASAPTPPRTGGSTRSTTRWSGPGRPA